MIEIPENIKDLFRQDRITEKTKKKIKLTFPDIGLTIENDRIVSESMTITESLCESEDLEFGSCDSSSFEIVVADILQDVTGCELFATVECGGYSVPLGYYMVESFVREADRRKRRITALDRMRKFNVDVSAWYNSLTFPLTIKAFRDSLCAHVGVGQEDVSLPSDNVIVKKTIEPKELSGLDVIKCICQINGCFGHIGRTGRLKYIFAEQTGLYPSESLFPEEKLYPSEFGGGSRRFEEVDSYKEMTYEDYEVEGITGIAIRQEEKDAGITVGKNENTYIIEGNFLLYGKTKEELEEIGNSIFEKIEGRTYRPANAIYRCRPWMEVGDQVRIYTRDDAVETFIMKRTISGIQALMDSIESTGSPKREEVFGIGRQIIQIEGRTAIIEKNVGEVSVSISDLSEKTESRFKITESAIESEVSRAKGEEGALSSRISQTESSISLKVSKGDVSSEISVETGDIIISGNRFSWSAANSSMTKSGILTCNGGVFKGDVTADHFKVNSSIKLYLGDSAQYTDIVKMVFDDGMSDMNNTYYNLSLGAKKGTVVNEERKNDGTTKYARLSGVTIPTDVVIDGKLSVFDGIDGLRGVSGLVIKGGSIVKTVSKNTSIAMFSDSELSSIMGVYGINITNTIVLFANGDGGAQDAHIDGSTHMGSVWYATTDRPMTEGNFRVNWVAIHFG